MMLPVSAGCTLFVATPIYAPTLIRWLSLLGRNSVCGVGNRISRFAQSAAPVIKGYGIDPLILTPLVIGKSTAAAFHDEFLKRD